MQSVISSMEFLKGLGITVILSTQCDYKYRVQHYKYLSQSFDFRPMEHFVVCRPTHLPLVKSTVHITDFHYPKYQTCIFNTFYFMLDQRRLSTQIFPIISYPNLRVSSLYLTRKGKHTNPYLFYKGLEYLRGLDYKTCLTLEKTPPGSKLFTNPGLKG